MKDMEMFAFSRIIDPLRKGVVEKKTFVREMNAYYKMLYDTDVDREM